MRSARKGFPGNRVRINERYPTKPIRLTSAPNLAREAFGRELACELGREHLHHDLPAQRGLFGKEYARAPC